MSEDLTEKQLELLRAELMQVGEELRLALESSDESARPVDLDQPIGRVSRIDAIQQQKMAEANRRKHEQRLREVTAALSRMSGGEYGLCVECEEPIAYRRLKARPESRLCLPCQSSREHRR